MLTNVGTLTKPFRWGPHIKPDDGVIDICIMKAKSIIDMFGVVWDIVVPGGIRRQRNLVYLSATDTVEISAERVLPVQGDGELLGKTPIEAKLIAGAVKVMVPKEKPHRLRLKLPVNNL
jgi:diacylglycerol kinase family enzyme